jgi:hypothetical protein
MKSIKISGAFLLMAAIAGCGADVDRVSDSLSGQGSALVTAGQPLPTVSGAFRGHYVVPVPANLAAAARYSVDSVEWSVASGIATLRYYLPIGLVGGSLETEFSGSLLPGANRVVLRSEDGGTATCTALETTVTCHEIFGDLGPLPISMKVVRAYAAREYAGPLEDRVAVANIFSSDPIGFVDFNVLPPDRTTVRGLH